MIRDISAIRSANQKVQREKSSMLKVQKGKSSQIKSGTH